MTIKLLGIRSVTPIPLVHAVSLLLLIALKVSAQYHIDSWTTDNGLPQNTVKAILQTRDGYLWLATNDGLARYDGEKFTIFDSSNTPGVCCDRFMSLYEDGGGALWAGTIENKLVKYHNRQFTSFVTTPDDPGAGAISINEDRAGNVVVSGYEGAFRGKNGDFSVDRRVRSYFFPTRSGAEWRFEGSQAISAQGGRQIVRRFPGSAKAVETVYEDRAGTLWIGTNRGLARLSDGDIELVPLGVGPSGLNVKAICEDSDGDLWVGTTEGLFRRHKGSVERIDLGLGAADNFVRSVAIDREGVIWVGTDARGLIKLTKKIIKSYTQQDGLASDNVYSVFEDSRGRIWIGSWPEGITIYENGRFKRFTHPQVKAFTFPIAFAEDSEGKIWISCDRLWCYKDGKVVDFTSLLPDQATTFHAILQDRSGAIWFGSARGLVRSFRDQVTLYTKDDGLADDEIKTLLEDRQGALWVGAKNGLTRMLNGGVTTYTKVNGLKSNHIRALYEDEEGTIWAGTFDGGLSRIKDGKVTTYTTAEGLFCKGAFNILDDGRGNLWMSCNSGIYSVNKTQLKEFAEGRLNSISSVPYRRGDGMRNPECNGGSQPAGVKARDGKLWFPTAGGVAVVDLSGGMADSPPLLLVIDRVELNGKRRDPESQLMADTHNTKLEIHYNSLSYFKPETIRYRYRMEGLDKNWIEVGNRRAAIYPYLPAGQYQFRLAASDAKGQWNELGKRISITVPAPYWQKWWFIGSVAFSLAAALSLAIYFYNRRRISILVKQSEGHLEFSRRLIESQELERRKIARELHDDVVNELASLAVSVFNLSRQVPQAGGQLKQGIINIHDQAMTLTESIRNISHALHPASLQHLGLLPAIRSICNEFTVKEKVAVDLFLDDSLVSVSSEADICLYRIVQEALRNVAKHAQAKSVLVSLRRHTGRVELIISDDGVGFDDVEVSSARGLGLLNMKERLAGIGGDLRITPSLGQGVEIIASIPLSAPRRKSRWGIVARVKKAKARWPGQ